MPKSKRGGKRAKAKTGFEAMAEDRISKGGYDMFENSFFGTQIYVSNKYFHFDHYHSDEEVVIVTNNIKEIKRQTVLVVGEHDAVYVPDWNIALIHNYDYGINAYAVKLNKKYFKKYTFRYPFDEFDIPKSETWDDMLKIAKEQNKANLKWANGHMKGRW